MAATGSFPKLSFSLDSSSQQHTNHARTATLHFEYSDKLKDGSLRPSRTIRTPNILAYTKKGSVPHLTRDNLIRLPHEMVHLSLEHFLDQLPPPHLKAPTSLQRYLGLHEHPTKAYQQPVAIMGLRDPSLPDPSHANQNDLILATSSKGIARITPSQYTEFALAKPADIIIGASDEPHGALSSKKLEKVLKRTLQWNLDFAKVSEGKANLFMPLVGAQSIPLRTEFSQALLGKVASRSSQLVENQPVLDSSVTGYALTIDTSIPVDACELALASLAPLPIDKPRLATGVNGPFQILRVIKDVGIDLFVDDWSSHLSTIGIALDFDFPVAVPRSDTPSLKKLPIAYSLYLEEYDRSFVPLSSSSLALDEKKEPHPFGPIPPTRAYVHHLLKAREMTSYVILAQHNLIVMNRFFASIRNVLNRDGSQAFEKAVKEFEDVYQDQEIDDPKGRGFTFVHDATTEFEKINKERGKGSLRDKLAKDLLPATGGEGVSTPLLSSEVAQQTELVN